MYNADGFSAAVVLVLLILAALFGAFFTWGIPFLWDWFKPILHGFTA